MALSPPPPAVTLLVAFPLLPGDPHLSLCRMLRKDKEEAEAIKHAKALEEEKAMYSVRAGPGEGRSASQGGHAPHHPGTHPTPGPSLPAPAEGVPGEAPEGPEDQPTQVGWVLPRAPHPASVSVSRF